jgi:HK97 family phage major capsid protein
MASLIAILEDRSKALKDERTDLFAKAEKAGSLDEHRARLDEIEAELPTVEADLARAQAKSKADKEAPAAAIDAEGPITPVTPFTRGSVALADQFLGNEDWQAYIGRQSGLFSNSVRIESPKIPIQGSLIAPFRPSALIASGATSGGAFILPGQSGIFDEGPFRRPLTILDLVTRGTTDSNTVEFVRTTGFTNLSAIVPEADDVAATDNTGRKPWSSIALERISEPVKTIAHGEAATTAALADAGQMRTIIENWLRYGLLETLDNEILNGTGGASHFDGIDHVAGTQTQAFSSTIAQTIRKAKTKVRLNGKTDANGVVLHPNDWEALDLYLTLAGQNSYRDAGSSSIPRIWGLAVVESEAQVEGSATVGDFRRAVLWDRQQTTVQATSGYMDFFMKNLVAILAELRAAFGVIRPKAFVIADVGTGS